MRLTSFRIENFRNIRLAECNSVPDFMVVCGGNGCGKSALLSAIITAKESIGQYRHSPADPRVVAAGAETATVTLGLQFSQQERSFVAQQINQSCPERAEIAVEIPRDGSARPNQVPPGVGWLLSSYLRRSPDPPGFFDYFDAHRTFQKIDLSVLDGNLLKDDQTKQTLTAPGPTKFQNAKHYLAALTFRDLQALQRSIAGGTPATQDSLEAIRGFFDDFFSPMRFKGIDLQAAPFPCVIETPRGEIDIDDMSAGEKEVFNTFIRFHQLNPIGAVILFDEADVHLHPDLERRYLELLRAQSGSNQLILTTHSPEMMIGAGSESLYTVLRDPPAGSGNQLVRVTEQESLHVALSEVMGSRGLVSFNQRIVFIEGDESSADREVYERLYPPSQYHVSFVPAGNSATVRKTAERVNELLSASVGFQHYFSIVDGDIPRSVPPPAIAGATRLFELPVYHVENFLLEDAVLFAALRDLLASRCPYTSERDVTAALRTLVTSPTHVKALAGAMHDARVAKVANEAYDAVFRPSAATTGAMPVFSQTEADATAMMNQALSDGTWRALCKGREVLRSLCAMHGLQYVPFRNLAISKLAAPPPALARIMDQILA